MESIQINVGNDPEYTNYIGLCWTATGIKQNTIQNIRKTPRNTKLPLTIIILVFKYHLQDKYANYGNNYVIYIPKNLYTRQEITVHIINPTCQCSGLSTSGLNKDIPRNKNITQSQVELKIKQHRKNETKRAM